MNEDSRLTQWAHEMLTEAGIRPETADLLDQAIILLLIVLIAWAADLVCRFLILGVGKRIAAQADKKWKGVLVERSVLRKFSDLIPVILVYLLIPLAFPARSHTPAVLQTICLIYVIFIIIMLLNALLKVTFAFLNRRDEMHDRPLKGMLQILQVSLFFVGGIVIIGLIVGRSPLHLLAGLGASAAILMLIFKDSILGFVSGIMLSANKMLKPGDWISMPKYNVDGTVLEVTLNTVKIENFDNTITTIPPFVLTGDSFKNWRWMEESDGRRIMRSISIDMSSVRFCTPEAIERYRKIPLVNDFIAEHEKKAETSAQTGPDGARQAALYRLTNLTLFRAYLNNYLKALSVVNKELTCMVRHLQPTPTGIPIEIYCFSSIKEWVAYEGVQADLFDHVIAVVPDFDLVLFQSPAGTDLQRWMQPQPAPETVRSADYGLSLWVGVPSFDYRYERLSDEEYVQWDIGTATYIYAIPPRSIWGDVSFHDREWHSARLDLLPLIRRGVAAMQAKGQFVHTMPEDLELTGMNFGWEVPGTFDAGLQIRNLSIRIIE